MSKKSKFLIQYDLFKDKYPDHLVLVQKGMFYIALNKDAELLSKICKFKIKNFTNENISRCGFPVGNLEQNVKNINNEGYRVIICDEKNEYDERLGIKKREITKVQELGEKMVGTSSKIDKNKTINGDVRIYEKIKELNIEKTSPIEALNFLYKIKESMY